MVPPAFLATTLSKEHVPKSEFVWPHLTGTSTDKRMWTHACQCIYDEGHEEDYQEQLTGTELRESVFGLEKRLRVSCRSQEASQRVDIVDVLT